MGGTNTIQSQKDNVLKVADEANAKHHVGPEPYRVEKGTKSIGVAGLIPTNNVTISHCRYNEELLSSNDLFLSCSLGKYTLRHCSLA